MIDGSFSVTLFYCPWLNSKTVHITSQSLTSFALWRGYIVAAIPQFLSQINIIGSSNPGPWVYLPCSYNCVCTTNSRNTHEESQIFQYTSKTIQRELSSLSDHCGNMIRTLVFNISYVKMINGKIRHTYILWTKLWHLNFTKHRRWALGIKFTILVTTIYKHMVAVNKQSVNISQNRQLPVLVSE